MTAKHPVNPVKISSPVLRVLSCSGLSEASLDVWPKSPDKDYRQDAKAPRHMRCHSFGDLL